MTYSVEFRHVDAQPIAAVRRRAAHRQLATVVPEACGEAWNAVQRAGIAGAGRLVAVYLNGAIDLEVGVEVPQPFPSDAHLISSSTPAGMVASTVHWGPYDRLSLAHDAIREGCAATGRSLAGPSWEIYGHWNDDPSQLRTDVFYLLQGCS